MHLSIPSFSFQLNFTLWIYRAFQGWDGLCILLWFSSWISSRVMLFGGNESQGIATPMAVTIANHQGGWWSFFSFKKNWISALKRFYHQTWYIKGESIFILKIMWYDGLILPFVFFSFMCAIKVQFGVVVCLNFFLKNDLMHGKNSSLWSSFLNKLKSRLGMMNIHWNLTTIHIFGKYTQHGISTSGLIWGYWLHFYWITQRLLVMEKKTQWYDALINYTQRIKSRLGLTVDTAVSNLTGNLQATCIRNVSTNF